jgi:mono/diheme cytochrome c family protein
VVLCAGVAALAARYAAAGVPTTPDLARGEHIARLICSACHVVAANQEYPPILTRPAPSFTEIANRPGVSAESLQHFIVNTHWDVDKLPMAMPNPMLSKDEVRAVSRYILSLRNH